MDVMKPDLEWIENICYRINSGNYSSSSYCRYEEQSYEQDDVCPVEVYDDESFDDIEEIDGGRFRMSFHVAKIFFPYIIGSKGATKKRLESETRSKIVIPKPGLDGDIIVTGADRKSVCSAKRRILLMVASSRKRQAFTHFISIPFNSVPFKNGFLNFKDEVLKSCRGGGVEESIFQNPDKLHLTICTMVLGDDVERKQAASVLEKCKEEVLSPLFHGQPLKMVMSGIEYMNDDPSAIDVLYGKVSCPENPELLQTLSDTVVEFFVKQGIVDREHDHVKLHVTLMNTLFRSPSDSYDSKKQRETFDGSRIISMFQDFFFGSDIITRIDLSLRYSSAKNGYYQATACVEIP